jgi:hypothetical protein
MKVTALLPDDLIKEVQDLSHGKTITESLKIALIDWIKIQRLKSLNQTVQENPIQFEHAAEDLRKYNQQ